MDPLSIALALLLLIESNDNPRAIGDGHKAVGCMQTWKVTVDDANRILRRKVFTYEDRLSRQKSLMIARIVLKHYGRPERLGRPATVEDYVRMWKSGPNGYAKSDSINHWRKAKAVWKSGEYRATFITIVEPELAANNKFKQKGV